MSQNPNLKWEWLDYFNQWRCLYFGKSTSNRSGISTPKSGYVSGTNLFFEKYQQYQYG